MRTFERNIDIDYYRSLVHIYNRTLTSVRKGWAINWAFYSSTECGGGDVDPCSFEMALYPSMGQ